MKLRRIGPYIPESALPLVRSVYGARALCWYTDLREHGYVEGGYSYRLPPASLRYRVHGAPDAQSFLKVGKRCSEDVEAALERAGSSIRSGTYWTVAARTHDRLVRLPRGMSNQQDTGEMLFRRWIA